MWHKVGSVYDEKGAKCLLKSDCNQIVNLKFLHTVKLKRLLFLFCIVKRCGIGYYAKLVCQNGQKAVNDILSHAENLTTIH